MYGITKKTGSLEVSPAAPVLNWSAGKVSTEETSCNAPALNPAGNVLSMRFQRDRFA